MKSKYATLNAVMNACREVLLGNGIWVPQDSVPVEPGSQGLVTKLMHAESAIGSERCRSAGGNLYSFAEKRPA